MNQVERNTEINFEEAMAEIKEIVDAIEGGELPLNESMQKYERGLQLIKQCQSILENANQRIERIKQQTAPTESGQT